MEPSDLKIYQSNKSSNGVSANGKWMLKCTLIQWLLIELIEYFRASLILFSSMNS
jgi:hypothetical protein